MRFDRGWASILGAVVGVFSLSAQADSYEYDELGNVKTLTSPRGVRTYTYDAANRLDTEAGYVGVRDHAYDRNGNRSTDGSSAPTVVTYASNSNRAATINGVSISIDAAGQITNDGLNSYTWDGAGRLKTVSRGGQLRATYYYDHMHRRSRKVTTVAAPQGAQTILYSYDDENRLVSELRGDGAPLRAYVWADDNLLGQAEYKANATNTGYEVSRVLYYEMDHLGAPRQARLGTGQVQWRWESDGYGTTAANEDVDGDGIATKVYLRFPGQYFDEESGLHYNWHRYYAPKLGRYISSDPIGIKGGGNPYAYTIGNPLHHSDPTGLDIAIINNGPTASNPVGHSAVAVTGHGVFSYGNGTSIGSSLSSYLRRESGRRDTDVVVIPTTSAQDKAAVDYFSRYPNNSLPVPTGNEYLDALLDAIALENCAARTSGAMNSAGLPIDLTWNPRTVQNSSKRFSRDMGGATYSIPRGATNINIPSLIQFEPR